MTRTLTALSLAVLALFGTAGCTDNGGSGDSNPPATETDVPAPVPS